MVSRGTSSSSSSSSRSLSLAARSAACDVSRRVSFASTCGRCARKPRSQMGAACRTGGAQVAGAARLGPPPRRVHSSPEQYLVYWRRRRLVPLTDAAAAAEADVLGATCANKQANAHNRQRAVSVCFRCLERPTGSWLKLQAASQTRLRRRRMRQTGASGAGEAACLVDSPV